MLSKAEVSFMIIFLSLVCQVVTFEFSSSGEEGVEFGAASGNIQNINVDENNNSTRRVKVVHIDKATSEPTFNAYGDENLLKIQIGKVEENPNQYYVEIISLNYEAISKYKYLIQIKVTGDEDQILQLYIQNVDDEQPTLTANTCKMKENTPITVDNTNCIFTVQDPDGYLNKMDFSNIIATEKHEDNLFELVYKDTPGEKDTESPVYLVLQDGQLLDYEKVTLYTFHVKPKDDAGHPTTPIESVPIILEVEDIPDNPPIWTSFTSSKQITEEKEEELIVTATDGDYGIANKINYKIEDGDEDHLTIDEISGKITISAIDRDGTDGTNGTSSLTFSVTAYEVGDPDKIGDNYKLTSSITLIIEDIDDNKPEISIPNSTAKILEINIDENAVEIEPILLANDIDLGDNAMYTVKLKEDDQNPNSKEFIKAFGVIPPRGYGNTNLKLTVTDPTKLDYEDTAWRTITFNVYTQGTKNSANNCTFPVQISLNDLNDEAPVFDQEEYNIHVYENYTVGLAPIVTIIATDADAEDADGVQLELLGTMANSLLKIESNGSVIAKVDKPFDYEKQNVISIQVKATDKNNNTNTVELIINVLDLNDEPPRLTVGQEIRINENLEDGTVIESSITASDEDKSADLHFEIDWDKSSATKNSAPVKDEDFQSKIRDSISVETITDNGNNQEATAKLSIHEIVKGNTPDHELFDTLLLTLTVEDKATDSGYTSTSSATIYINILNLNDNEPEFRADTLTTKTVVENANKDNTNIVGVVTATDKDNLNELAYSIRSANDETPEWIDIDNSGNLLVKDGAVIDCDKLGIDNVTYTVTASDGDHNVDTNITIKIIDANDESPVVQSNITISIEEDNEITNETVNNSTIYNITYMDGDYSEPFHTVSCLQSSTDPIISQRFQVGNNTIKVALQGTASLDREINPQFTFTLYCFDDPNHTGPISNNVAPPPAVTIILIDVNDKIPTIITTDGITLNENSEIGTTIPIKGEDGDTEERGEINFELTKIHRTSGSDNEDLDLKLFSIKQDENKKDATLTLAGSLKGYYGQLLLTITTTDNGNPPLSSENTVTINVDKYNFEEPKFAFPDEKVTYYLNEKQDPNKKLKLWNGDNTLQDLEAWDQQGNKFPIDFDIASDGSQDKIFTIANPGRADDGKYTAELQVKKSDFRPDESVIEVIIKAKINTTNSSPLSGEAPYEKNCTMKIRFFNEASDPIFDYHEDTFEPRENDTEVHYDLKSNATYPIDLPPLPIAYYLYSGDEKIFQVDKSTGRLTPTQALDYEVTQEYTVIIQASNNEENPSKNPSSASLLNITIQVQDINDNWPEFEQSNYFETLVYKSVRTVAILTATDADESSKTQLRYSITKTVPNPNSLKGSFNINAQSGKIEADFDLTEDMKGYYTLTVQVQDEAPESHTNTAEVKIYIVGTPHLVEFRFKNPQETVQKKKNSGEIKKILDDQFKLQSNIEDTTYKDNATTVPIYFLDTSKNEPVEGVTILDKVTNADTFNTLSSRFSDIGLNLMNFQTDTDTNENIEEILKGCLIGVSVVLGSLCLALLVAFILKTRALNQRIKNLSNTKFGSQESGLNRQGVNAPTTNKHAIEGSNPVYSNNEVDEVETKHYDPRLSVTSGDSDLIGVEDDDKFDYNYPTKDDEYNSVG